MTVMTGLNKSRWGGGVVILVLCGAIASCSAPPMAQCQKLGAVLSAAERQLDDSGQADPTVAQVVALAEVTIPQLETLKLRDKTLKQLNQALIAAAREFAAAGKELERQSPQTALTMREVLEGNRHSRFQAASQDAQGAVEAIERYCSGDRG